MNELDERLLTRCRASDERALHQLYHHCYSMLKGIAVRYVFDRDEIPEVINRAFVKVVKGLDSYDQRQPLGPWVATITIHTALDYVRKTMRDKPKRLQLEEDMTTQMASHHDWNQADREFDAAGLLELLNILPPRTKVVFNLYAIDGYSHQEIGTQLGISTGTSKWHVSKARELLQEALYKRTNEEKVAS
ncbi:MAG: RNA polymerase sigma factor [Bacteroidota bacterium]